ncbi:ABC transporter ATP-binding protein [Anaerosporobacter faecicola]|uniref:ABC transporter ATP-binding protein n=1 Tax=Anaerosporobacter faecicola TaxID=2718714 RepID=UPI001439DA15|nr:ABC transporter ATP-binding protein [Anaerosporobacter faecicola]
MEYILQTNNLTKIYGGKSVVDHVNMTIKKGDIYGFIGKNGAGKTTLIRMVAGLAHPTQGEIKLFESNDLDKQRKRIGTTIENPALYPNMTAKQNLEYYVKLYGIPEKDAVDQVLKLVGLEDTKRKKSKNFSLGMKQRLAIAIALLGNPDFLMLDEPTNGLDPFGIKEMRELLLRLNKQGITILISSHILGELSKIATVYGIINNGILVEEYTKQELEERCKRCLKIKVDDTKKASMILEENFQTVEYDVLPENIIRVFDPIDCSGEINRKLVLSGVTVESISLVGQDLEGYFVELMEGKNHD